MRRLFLIVVLALAACGGTPEQKQCTTPPAPGCFLQDNGNWYQFHTADNVYGWAITPCECAQ
jgi:hypothetical protein